MVRSVSFILMALIGLAAGLTLAGVAQAGGTVGDGTPVTCTETALDIALNGGGSVTFNCGGPKTIALESTKVIAVDTTIDGGGVITLTAVPAHDQGLFRVADGGALTIRDISLLGGMSNNGGGGAIRNYGSLTVENVTFENSSTGIHYCGGALQILGDAVIQNSTFNNNVGGMGGAICVRGEPGTHVSINVSTFLNNQAHLNPNGFGGALYVDYGTVTVRDSIFLGNQARLGGAVYTNLATATVTMAGTDTGSVLSSPLQLNANNATWDGGAVFNQGSLSIHNAVVSVNRTPTQTLLLGYGGGIYSSGVLTLTRSYLSQNEGRFGGGLFVGGEVEAARGVVDETIFRRNLSGGRGGGMYVSGPVSASVSVSNSAFRDNAAVQGGGLARFKAALRVTNSSFTGNTAGNSGGGLHLGAGPAATDGPYVRLESVTVSGNTVDGPGIVGGGVFNYGLLELYSTTIVNNMNGVYSANGANTRFRNTVLRNVAYLNCDSDGTASISDDGNNLSTDTSCALPLSQTGYGLTPILADLATDTRGPTSYHMPLAGSPLINAGSGCPERDQLGAVRPDACDIGAVEYGGRFLSYLWLPAVAR